MGMNRWERARKTFHKLTNLYIPPTDVKFHWLGSSKLTDVGIKLHEKINNESKNN